MDEEEKPKSKTFDAYDVQRIRLDKLFANIEKPVEIPERQTERKNYEAPDFVRNVMGSSAGAGSGEFHVYRQIRSKEFARIKRIEESARQQNLDEEYHHKLELNKRKAEELTEKNRLKRLKKKEKEKRSKLRRKQGVEGQSDQDSRDTNNDDDGKTVERAAVDDFKPRQEAEIGTSDEQQAAPKPKQPTVRIIEED